MSSMRDGLLLCTRSQHKVKCFRVVPHCHRPSVSLRYEINQDCKRAVRFLDETTVEVDGHHGAKQFVFDSVFSEEHGQADIFEDTRNLVRSALDG